MYSKNPFKQINSKKPNSDNVSESGNWAKNTQIVLEHIRKQIPQSTGHCASRKRILKNVKCQGRLASLGKPSELDETYQDACLGIVSDGVIFSPGPDVQTRAIFIAALANKLDMGENPFEITHREGESVHRTSIASSASIQINFLLDSIQDENPEKCVSNPKLHSKSENGNPQTNSERVSSCEPVLLMPVDNNHKATSKSSFSYV